MKMKGPFEGVTLWRLVQLVELQRVVREVLEQRARVQAGMLSQEEAEIELMESVESALTKAGSSAVTARMRLGLDPALRAGDALKVLECKLAQPGFQADGMRVARHAACETIMRLMAAPASWSVGWELSEARLEALRMQASSLARDLPSELAAQEWVIPAQAWRRAEEDFQLVQVRYSGNVRAITPAVLPVYVSGPWRVENRPRRARA